MDLELFNHRDKCRWCFEPLRSKTKKSIQLTREIRQEFYDFTRIEVSLLDMFSGPGWDSNSELSAFVRKQFLQLHL